MAERPRVLVLSERGAEPRKWQASQFEFEDLIGEVDRAEIVAPPRRSPSRMTRWSNRLARVSGHRERIAEPRLERVQATGEYELLFAFFTFADDISHLLRLRGWRERCQRAICFIMELVTHDVDRNRPYLELLKELGFDRVFLFNPAPREAVAELSGAQVEFMPLGVDALRFSPFPDPPPRVVDLYEFGRRSEATHAAALDMARRDGAFYIYDTIFNVPLPDYRAHRELIAAIMKRSRYFFAYRAGADVDRSRQDDVLSSRYFEGIAGGALLLGSAPATPEYEQCFGWPDSTIPIPYDAHHLREIVADLESQPDRLELARTRNVVETLRRHDWAYRWGQILDAAGLSHTARMEKRFERLEELAAMAEQQGSSAGSLESTPGER